MRVLLIKTSSMGDIIHTLPALTDAALAHRVVFDWVVEEAFAEIPSWHPNVAKVIPLALRRWRKTPFSLKARAEWKQLRQKLQEERYDIILDAQGLVKSALLTRYAKGLRVGLDWGSARENVASLFYQKKCSVNFHQHAIVRMRSLFSQALQYPLPQALPDSGLRREAFIEETHEDYLVFLHGTTWSSKQWPEPYWIALANLAGEAGLRIKVSAGNELEKLRAERLAKASAAIDVIPKLSLHGMACLLANAKGTIALDTGLGHLSAALNVPTISLYSSTDPAFTGALGQQSQHLAAHFMCAPCLNRVCRYRGPTLVTPACFGSVTPSQVWQAVAKLICY